MNLWYYVNRLISKPHRAPLALFRLLASYIQIEIESAVPRFNPTKLSEVKVKQLCSGNPLSSDTLLEEATTLSHFIWQEFPTYARSLVHKAEQYLQHIHNILGPETVNLEDFSQEKSEQSLLPWHWDFRSGYRWSDRRYWKRIRYGHRRGVEVRVPAELSCGYHLVTLGQAYFLTCDEQYAKEVRNQILDWIDHNPWKRGVNWAFPMMVGFRALNWLWAWWLCCKSQYFNDNFRRKFFISLLEHGEFLWSQKEKEKHNHLFGLLLGLTSVALALPEYEEATNWLNYVVKKLEVELEEQVHSDGLQYEGSLSYHRLVLEMIFNLLFLLQIGEYKLPSTCKEKVSQMLEAMLILQRTDGSIPQIGDTEGARPLNLGVRDITDHSHLQTIGCLLLDKANFKQESVFAPEALWLFGEKGYKRWLKYQIPAIKTLETYAFPFFGVYVINKGNNRLVIAQRSRQKKLSNLGHAHCDRLSFELYWQDQPVIIDPGTYTYTSDLKYRNYFRSAQAHNILAINGENWSYFNPYHPFHFEDQGTATCLEFKQGAKEATFIGEIRVPKICYRREFRCRQEELIITDTIYFDQQRPHRFDWYFHLHPSVTGLPSQDGVILKFQSYKLLLKVPEGFKDLLVLLEKGFYSKSYGFLSEAEVIHVVWQGVSTKPFVFKLVNAS